MNAYAFIYLADVVLTGISKEPVVTIQILDSDRHQRASGCLPLTDKTADKKRRRKPLSDHFCAVSNDYNTNNAVLSENTIFGKGTGR